MTSLPPLDPALALAHAIFSSRGVYALLLGSGISRSSKVPTGWDITIDLVRRVADLEGADPLPDPEGWYLGRYGTPPSYSDLLARLAPTAAERRTLLQGYFEPTEEEREEGAKLPSPAHRAIARLMRAGYVRVLLTTNFDRLMETALRDEGIEPTVISTPDAADGAAPLVHQRCVVLKLHGDYLDDRVKNTYEELSSYDPRMDAYLDRVLDDFGLVVCGWSGEWDPALRAAIERCRSRRYTTWWATVGEPGSRASNLISIRQAEVVRTGGADALLPAVQEKVASLEELRSEPLLSIPTAVATLKRYIAEDRHRVRLDDLLREEVARVNGQLMTEFPHEGGPSPTPALIADRVRKMDALTEKLRHMFFHGCRFALPDQRSVFVRTLELMGQGSEGVGGGYQVWVELAPYPMSTVLYAGCLGALAREDWALLLELVGLRYRVRGRERIACEPLSALRAMGRAAEHLYTPKRRTPASDHYAATLLPLLQGVVPDPELLFDELEVLLALAYLDLVRDLAAGPAWMPAGRFCWKGNWGRPEGSQPGPLFVDADNAGTNWAPLQSGWFAGKRARFDEVRAAFEDTRARFASQMW